MGNIVMKPSEGFRKDVESSLGTAADAGSAGAHVCPSFDASQWALLRRLRAGAEAHRRRGAFRA